MTGAMNFTAGDAAGNSFTSDTIDLLVVDYSCKSARECQAGLSHLEVDFKAVHLDLKRNFPIRRQSKCLGRLLEHTLMSKADEIEDSLWSV